MRRSPVTLGISMARLARIVAYEPDDMTVVDESGITGAAQSGPLRLSEGTSRDLLIGVRFVGHGGSVIHGGGRVVKNVAGYDLMKLMGGSFGTLGILTELTFKVRPIPPEYCLALIPYARSIDAFAAARILNDALPLSNLDIVSPALATRVNSTTQFLLLAGFSGSPLEIGYQAERIRDL